MLKTISLKHLNFQKKGKKSRINRSIQLTRFGKYHLQYIENFNAVVFMLHDAVVLLHLCTENIAEVFNYDLAFISNGFTNCEHATVKF